MTATVIEPELPAESLIVIVQVDTSFAAVNNPVVELIAESQPDTVYV